MKFDRHTLVLLVRPPNAPELTDEEAAELQDRHLAFRADLRDRGYLVGGGPLVDQDDDHLRGISIMSCDPETARRLSSEDPGSAGGPARSRGDDLDGPRGQRPLRGRARAAVDSRGGGLTTARRAALRLRSLAWIAAGLLLLGFVRLLPAEGLGLALRLAVPAALVLLLPGLLVVTRVGAPSDAAALPAALAWSLAILFAALVVTFLVGASSNLTLGLVAAVSVGVALLPDRSAVERPARSDLFAPAGVALAGAVFGVAVWLAAGPLRGDALFHLARARKLVELPELDSLRALSEFPDGGIHPGYALPLWHAVLALVARLGGVDVTDVVLGLSAVLTPLALVLAYAAGATLFRSWVGGVATAIAQVGVVQFAGENVSSFKLLALPVAASILLLVPALLALVFSFVASGERGTLLAVAAAALVLAVVHPTYALFVLASARRLSRSPRPRGERLA